MENRIVVRSFDHNGHLIGDPYLDRHQPRYESMDQVVGHAKLQNEDAQIIGSWIGEQGVIDVAVGKIKCDSCVRNIEIVNRKQDEKRG